MLFFYTSQNFLILVKFPIYRSKRSTPLGPTPFLCTGDSCPYILAYLGVFCKLLLKYTCIQHTDTSNLKRFEQTELQAKLLNYFLRSNKSNINQNTSLTSADSYSFHTSLCQCILETRATSHIAIPQHWGPIYTFLSGTLALVGESEDCRKI